MRLFVLALAALVCASCNTSNDDTAVPAASEIDRLERLLARHKCVGRLDAWERYYRFSRKSGLLLGHSLNPDLDVIEFHFRRAGTLTIEPGRHVMAPKPDGDWPDSGPIKTLDGRFKQSSSQLSLRPCPEQPEPSKATGARSSAGRR